MGKWKKLKQMHPCATTIIYGTTIDISTEDTKTKNIVLEWYEHGGRENIQIVLSPTSPDEHKARTERLSKAVTIANIDTETIQQFFAESFQVTAADTSNSCMQVFRLVHTNNAANNMRAIAECVIRNFKTISLTITNKLTLRLKVNGSRITSILIICDSTAANSEL